VLLLRRQLPRREARVVEQAPESLRGFAKCAPAAADQRPGLIPQKCDLCLGPAGPLISLSSVTTMTRAMSPPRTTRDGAAPTLIPEEAALAVLSFPS
jgi:hypothetical protein